MNGIARSDAQKRVEFKHLDSFRRSCGDFPAGKIEPGETPDFIVDSGNRRIGVELTRIYVDAPEEPNSLQSREAGKTRITRLAERFFNEKNLSEVYVDLFFNRTWQPYRNQEERIARAVAQVVFDNFPSEGQQVWVKYRLGSAQPIEVDLISIYRTQDFGRDRWRWREAGEVKKEAITDIQSEIDKKLRKVNECLTKCDECWLLIVVPSWTPAGMVHPARSSLEHTYTSQFSRVYLLNHSYGAVTLLNTIAASL